MEKILNDILVANTRGMKFSLNEREKPADMTDITELSILGYTNIYTYQNKLNLSNTINVKAVEENDKVYVNLNQKYKNCIPKKEDILLPITNVDFEPRFVNWDGDNKLNYIYHQKLILLRADITQIYPKFLFYILNTNHIRNYWREHSQDGEKYRLTCTTVGKLVIDVPSLEEQKSIVERTDRLNQTIIEMNNFYEELSKI